MQNNIDEIKSRIDIVDLISEYVRLQPSGTSFRALCPFHREKTPSFFVSPEKQIWHCFGQCSEGGDIFKFIMKMEGVEFPEALRILAKKAGVEIEKQDYHLKSQRTKLLDICQLAAKFYHKILLESPLAEQARAYLKKRRVSNEIIKEFNLGYAPDRWDAFLNFLTKRKIKEADIELAGLIISRIRTNMGTNNANIREIRGQIRDDSRGYYDRFRNRIIFPIRDIYGNTVGFTGRIMPGFEDEKTAKYVNTPETPVYNKSKILYGLDKAKSAIKEKKEAILVEGNMDVLACHQVGTENVVATSGTALTLEQVKLLKRYANSLLLAFDFDLAGETATDRGIGIALQQEVGVKVISLPKGKDPDECIKEDPKLWFKAIQEAQPIMDYYFSLALRSRDFKKIEDKKTVAKILIPVIAKLGDPVEQDLWLKKLSEEISVSEQSLRDSLKKIKLPRIFTKESESQPREVDQNQKTEERLIGLLISFPDQIGSVVNDFTPDLFWLPQFRELAERILGWYNQNNGFELDDFKKTLSDKNLIYQLDFLAFLIEKDFARSDKKFISQEIETLIKKIKKRNLSQKLTDLTQKLKLAEQEKDSNKIKELTEQIIDISRKIAKLES